MHNISKIMRLLSVSFAMLVITGCVSLRPRASRSVLDFPIVGFDEWEQHEQADDALDAAPVFWEAVMRYINNANKILRQQ